MSELKGEVLAEMSFEFCATLVGEMELLIFRFIVLFASDLLEEGSLGESLFWVRFHNHQLHQ